MIVCVPSGAWWAHCPPQAVHFVARPTVGAPSPGNLEHAFSYFHQILLSRVRVCGTKIIFPGGKPETGSDPRKSDRPKLPPCTWSASRRVTLPVTREQTLTQNLMFRAVKTTQKPQPPILVPTNEGPDLVENISAACKTAVGQDL